MKNQARAMFSDEEKQMNNKHDEALQIENVCNSMNSDLAETEYCDYSNAEINKVAKTFLEFKQNKRELVTKLFLFVRDDIIFGGDRWRVKASETLHKGYGACYNKNLLLVALLRYHGIPSQLCANPMSKNFNKPAIGYGYITMSTPFYHCFTKVLVDKKWVDIDPTLDKTTYDTFFAPLNIDWSVDWDGHSNMRLYNKEAIIGDSKIFIDIDRGIKRNLDSHFMFRYEPEFFISFWMSYGNSMMWKKTKNPPPK
jgi:transglutaminase-like putative cysteine protease